MTELTVREEIAAAANAVDGIEVYPYFESVSKDGQGYVEWLRAEYPNRLGGEDYWGVLIAVPADLAAAQQWVDQYRGPLIAALVKSRTLVVTAARPERVEVPDNAIIKMLVIEGHRESKE